VHVLGLVVGHDEAVADGVDLDPPGQCPGRTSGETGLWVINSQTNILWSIERIMYGKKRNGGKKIGEKTIARETFQRRSTRSPARHRDVTGWR
jgi:hypothetical protein